MSKATKRASAMIQPASLRRAHIAASLLDETIIEFVSKAVDTRAKAVLRAHNVKPPSDLVAA